MDSQTPQDKNLETPPENKERRIPGPEELQKEFSDLIQKKFGGHVKVMSMAGEMPDDETDEDLEDFEQKAQAHEKLLLFDKKPIDLKKELDRYIIGQDDAKKALSIAVCEHYNHLKASSLGVEGPYQKQNVMLLGPTGVGKTYLVRRVAELIGVPFVKADATRFSEVGYMGANVDDVIRDLVQKANGDVSLAEKGIVYVDEIDKIAGKTDQSQRDVGGRGVQFGFLRLLENSEVDLNASHDVASQFKAMMSFQKKGRVEKEVVSTKNILFVFSGAFHGIEKIISKRLNEKSIGIHGSNGEGHADELLPQVASKDLVDFGFEHEFVGRVPVKVACHSLDVDKLLSILTSSEESILNQYKASFGYYGIEIDFSKGALQALAEKAFHQKTGARALNAVFEETLRPFKFDLPSSRVKAFQVNEDLLANPLGYLHHLLQK